MVVFNVENAMPWEIALVFLLIALAILVAFAIPVVFRLGETLKNINQTLTTVNKDLPTVMENVEEISGTVNNISKKVEHTVEDIVELEQLFSKEIKEPLQNIANSIGMLLQIVNRLFDKKKKSK
jgi:uncharacterized protein YoxC